MAVLTKEYVFAERLCRYLNLKRRLNMTAVAFRDAEGLRQFEKNHSLSIVLTEKDIYKEDLYVGVKNGPEIFYLSGDREDAYSIYKFQSADAILSEVMLRTESVSFNSVYPTLKSDPIVIGVYSPSQQNYKTAFSVTLCRELQKYKRTLYISLEEFSDVMMIKEDEGKYSLSDAMYQFRQGGLDKNRLLAMIEHYDDFEYLQPMKLIDSIDIVRGEEYVELIECILNNSDYEAIVIDLPVHLGIAADIMDICTSVYVYVGTDLFAGYKTDEFLDYVEKSGKIKLKEKIIRVSPPEPEGSEGPGYFDGLIFGKMGDYIRENISEVIS